LWLQKLHVRTVKLQADSFTDNFQIITFLFSLSFVSYGINLLKMQSVIFSPLFFYKISNFDIKLRNCRANNQSLTKPRTKRKTAIKNLLNPIWVNAVNDILLPIQTPIWAISSTIKKTKMTFHFCKFNKIIHVVKTLVCVTNLKR
jgi:hypothetical protein